MYGNFCTSENGLAKSQNKFMYKKELLFLFSIISIFASSQDKVSFDNKLHYLVANSETIWTVSNKNSNLYLIDNITLNKKFIYYNGYLSKYKLNDIDEVNYNALKFEKEKERRDFQIISQEKTKIGSYNCIKYTVQSDRRIFEFYVTTKNKINNTAYLYSILETKKSNVFKAGLIVKINMHYESETEFKTFLNLEKISSAVKHNVIDITKLDNSLLTTEQRNKDREIQTTEVIPNK